jgi:hypothetical protein
MRINPFNFFAHVILLLTGSLTANTFAQNLIANPGFEGSYAAVRSSATATLTGVAAPSLAGKFQMGDADSGLYERNDESTQRRSVSAHSGQRHQLWCDAIHSALQRDERAGLLVQRLGTGRGHGQLR